MNISSSPTAEYSSNSSFKNSFLNEWNLLFGDNTNFEKIQSHCFEGKLRDSRLRSVIWRLLLKVLPLERQEWSKILEQKRSNYEFIKAKLNVDPRASNNDNPECNNPLSYQSESPWQQFFQDEELRECIRKDVDRTFPDLQFFQSSRTKEIMSDILFVYSKQNSHISYRQGMHELLATIIFAIYFDHRSFEHLSEQKCLTNLKEFDKETLQKLNDPKYLEHDSFSCFQQLFMLLENWFVADSEFSNSPKCTFEDAEPFSDKDSIPNSELLRRLNYINDELLSQVDPMLYRHLKSMEISVQIFGIRWFRLLFIREFHLHDLLFLWDVILAGPPTLGLVDYVFLALLLQIRDLLISSDYSGTLQYLMQYPPIADIYSFISLVLHLKFPKDYPKPRNYGMTLYPHITLSGTAHPNQEREASRAAVTTAGGATTSPISVKKSRPVEALLNKLGRQALAASPPNNKNIISSASNRNVPIKFPGKTNVRSMFYNDVEPRNQENINHWRVQELQRCTKLAVQRLARAIEILEQQKLPQQLSTIVELREIVALLAQNLNKEQETTKPSSLSSRSGSVSKADEPQQRAQVPSEQECEMTEMHFARKRNF